MAIDSVDSWSDAMKECESDNWETATLEARNQLTIFLSKHHRDKYRNWNNISREHKDALVNTLVDDLIRPFQEQHGLSVSLVHSVQWNVLASLMELSYIEYNHRCFFFHELFMVYESGHFRAVGMANGQTDRLSFTDAEMLQNQKMHPSCRSGVS